MLERHTDPEWWNRAVDVTISSAMEFKAFTLFSLLFGIGIAIQAERAGAAGRSAEIFLVRRFLVVTGLGLIHLFVIWNGDILTLYGVCGLLAIPFLRLRGRWLALAGAFCVVLPVVVSLPPGFPSADAIRADASEAARVYGHGGFAEILAFRVRETRQLMSALLIGVLPRTLGLMLIGGAVWKSGIIREPVRYRRVLLVAAPVLLVIGIVGSGDVAGNIPLAAGYGAAMLVWFSRAGHGVPAGLAALGRMALTNYLMQSVVLGLIFYGYGFGLFDRLGSAVGVLIGIALYAAQIGFSVWWLGRFRFGPFEWLWRSLSYGR